MADPMVFSRIMQGELPFTLNLPEGNYQLQIDGSKYDIELLQDRVAVPVGADSIMVGLVDGLKTQFADKWESQFRFELRTIVRKGEDIEVIPADLKEPDDDQLLEAAKTKILRNDSVNCPSGPEQLEIEAKAQLNQLSTEDRKIFAFDTAVRFAVRQLFPAQDIEAFCRATNILIRLYMTTFNDFFVQEIIENYFSGTAFHGILVETFCNGQPIDNTRHVGGLFPYMTRRPWLQHAQSAIDDFRHNLEHATEPDPVKLLNVRALSLLKRGGNRSAIIEASAAFDLCLKRKIRSGYRALGKTDAEIDVILEANSRYGDRAKKILKEATGSSAVDLDPDVWQRFVAHRTERGKVAHTATEPLQADAKAAVEDMINLTELIDALAIQLTK